MNPVQVSSSNWQSGWEWWRRCWPPPRPPPVAATVTSGFVTFQLKGKGAAPDFVKKRTPPQKTPLKRFVFTCRTLYICHLRRVSTAKMRERIWLSNYCRTGMKQKKNPCIYCSSQGPLVCISLNYPAANYKLIYCSSARQWIMNRCRNSPHSLRAASSLTEFMFLSRDRGPPLPRPVCLLPLWIVMYVPVPSSTSIEFSVIWCCLPILSLAFASHVFCFMNKYFMPFALVSCLFIVLWFWCCVLWNFFCVFRQCY